MRHTEKEVAIETPSDGLRLRRQRRVKLSVFDL